MPGCRFGREGLEGKGSSGSLGSSGWWPQPPSGISEVGQVIPGIPGWASSLSPQLLLSHSSHFVRERIDFPGNPKLQEHSLTPQLPVISFLPLCEGKDRFSWKIWAPGTLPHPTAPVIPIPAALERKDGFSWEIQAAGSSLLSHSSHFLRERTDFPGKYGLQAGFPAPQLPLSQSPGPGKEGRIDFPAQAEPGPAPGTIPASHSPGEGTERLPNLRDSGIPYPGAFPWVWDGQEHRDPQHSLLP